MAARTPTLPLVPAVAISVFLMIAIGNTQVAAPRLSEVKVTVFDQIGAVVPDCEVVFTGDSKPVVSHTGAEGSVTVTLPSGTYAIRTTKAGFLKDEILDFRTEVVPAGELRIVLKVDPDVCKNNACICMGPNGCGEPPIVPTTTSDVPSVVEGPEIHPLMVGGGPMPITFAPPAVKKSRSWRCLYLWKCCSQRPSHP